MDLTFSISSSILNSSLPMSTKEKEETKTEGKKAGADAPPTHLGWDTHNPVVRRGFAQVERLDIVAKRDHS